MVGKYPARSGWDGKAPTLKGVGIQESCTRCLGFIKKFVDADVLYTFWRMPPPSPVQKGVSLPPEWSWFDIPNSIFVWYSFDIQIDIQIQDLFFFN